MKKEKATFYIIPGWKEGITSKNYQQLIKFAKKRYLVVLVKYTTKKGTLLSQNIKEAENQITKPTSRDLLLGFSHGALMAYQLASRSKFRKAVICSISPIIGKDLASYPKKEIQKVFDHRQIRELSKMIYRKPLSKFLIFYGTEEPKQVILRSKWIHRRFGGELILIDKQRHELTENYLKILKSKLIDKSAIL